MDHPGKRLVGVVVETEIPLALLQRRLRAVGAVENTLSSFEWGESIPVWVRSKRKEVEGVGFVVFLFGRIV